MEYRFPNEIDAHLSDAALDGTEVVLTLGSEQIPGRFDMSDGFGLVTFLPQGAWQPRPNSEVQASYSHGGRIWAFITRVVDQAGRSRWHLRRPRHITESNESDPDLS